MGGERDKERMRERAREREGKASRSEYLNFVRSGILLAKKRKIPVLEI